MVKKLSRAKWEGLWYFRKGNPLKKVPKSWRHKITGEIRLDVGGKPEGIKLGKEPKHATPYGFNPVRKDRARRDKHFFEYEIKRKKYKGGKT